jgi:hypothetical protein
VRTWWSGREEVLLGTPAVVLGAPVSLADVVMRVPARGAYTAFEGALAWRGALRGKGADLDLSAGYRAGGRAERGEAWDASGAVWLTRWMAVVGSTGRYLRDPVQGLAGGRYATLGLRVRAAPLAASRVTGGRARDAPSRPRFAVRGAGEGMRTIVVRAPGARSVEVMGDFTDWQPLALARAGADEWQLTLPLAPGSYRVNLRVDGGAWIVPPGLTPLPDDFVGAAGLLIVP